MASGVNNNCTMNINKYSIPLVFILLTNINLFHCFDIVNNIDNVIGRECVIKLFNTDTKQWNNSIHNTSWKTTKGNSIKTIIG